MRIKNSFLLGIITGVGIGYYLASNDREQIFADVKSTAGKVKDAVEEGFQKGKQMVSDMRNKKSEGEEN